MSTSVREADAAPDTPTEVPKQRWVGTLKRTLKEFQDDNLTDWAAALTYYTMLSLFPALAALVSVVGLVGDPATTTRTLLDIVGQLSPQAVETLREPIENITSNRGGAGLALIVGLAVALWSASGYVGAFIRADNAIYEKPEGRPFWKLRPLQILVTLVMVVLLAIVLLAVVATGPVAKAVGENIGLGDTAITVWNIAKWPVLLAMLMLMLGILYHTSPNVKLPGFRWISPGAVVAVIVWIVASALFAFYVTNFGSYNKTYGTFAGVIIFLLWIWLTNLAILFGAELNAELERSREIQAGVRGAEREIQLEPRSEPKDKKSAEDIAADEVRARRADPN
jgi:membrane protein